MIRNKQTVSAKHFCYSMLPLVPLFFMCVVNHLEKNTVCEIQKICWNKIIQKATLHCKSLFLFTHHGFFNSPTNMALKIVKMLHDSFKEQRTINVFGHRC
jgi:hypothetical protein